MTNKKYVAAIDQGTTSTRCIIFDHNGEQAAVGQLEHEQIFPEKGWVEPVSYTHLTLPTKA